jgi:sugar transferase (PEP-CTERM/EpsH1 system associated)
MRILWIKTELLHPLDKGGRIRTFGMLRELRRDHHVTYLTLDDGKSAPDAVKRAAEYCHELVRVPFVAPRKKSIRFALAMLRNQFSDRPYVGTRYRSTAQEKAVREQVRRGRHDVLVCDFLSPSVNIPDDIDIPKVLFQHNVEAAIWERRALVARNAAVRLFMRQQAGRMRYWERRECSRFDHVVAVSDADRDTMREWYGVQHVSSVPTGVDVEYFTPRGEARRSNEIVFTGSMDWMPNADGIVWFCDEVLPLIRKAVPEAELTIVGRNPVKRLVALANEVQGVTVTGRVPDVRPYLERAAVLIVPLRVGGGTRIKIFEGMAMGRPTVSTGIGAEGLPVRDGEEIIIADDATRFADAVARLLSDKVLADSIGGNAAKRVRSEFGWDVAADRFARICASVIGEHEGKGPAGIRADMVMRQ